MGINPLDLNDRQKATPAELETRARTIAHILGSFSSAARALNELDERRRLGQKAWLEFDEATWYVVWESHSPA